MEEQVFLMGKITEHGYGTPLPLHDVSDKSCSSTIYRGFLVSLVCHSRKLGQSEGFTAG